MRKMRIFIADADRDVRVGLQMLLDREAGMSVVGIAVRSGGLLGQVGAAQPDIVLLDWDLVKSAHKSYVKNLHAIASQPHIILTHIRPETRGAAEDAGADGFISKDSPPDQLCMVLRKIKQERFQEDEMKE